MATGIRINGPETKIEVTCPSGGVTTLNFTDRSANATVNLPFGVGQLNPMTTAGDMIIGGAEGVETRLPIGTSGYFLTVSGGVPAWGALPKGAAVTNATENLTSVTTQLNALLTSLRNAGYLTA